MEDTVGSYKYNGFSIYGKTEYNPEWFAEPTFLVKMFPEASETDMTNFLINNRVYDDSMTTIFNAKKFIRENKSKLKADLIKLAEAQL